MSRNLAPFEFQPRTTDFLYVRLLGDYTPLNMTGTANTGIAYRKLAVETRSRDGKLGLEDRATTFGCSCRLRLREHHFEGFALESAQTTGP